MMLHFTFVQFTSRFETIGIDTYILLFSNLHHTFPQCFRRRIYYIHYQANSEMCFYKVSAKTLRSNLKKNTIIHLWSNFWKWIKRWERDHKQYDIRKRVHKVWGIYSLMIFRFCLFAHKNTTESIQIHTSMPKYFKLPSAEHSFQHWNLPLGLGDKLSDSRTRSELSLKHHTYMNQTEKTQHFTNI